MVAGLDTPWGLVAARDGTRAGQRAGHPDDRARRRRAAARRSRPWTTSEPGGEGGLLGLAADAGRADGLRLLHRRRGQPDRGDELGRQPRWATPTAILTGIPKGGRHNGGRMVVGPDGLLYVGTGDAGDADLAQDKDSLGGKILRITPTGQPAAGNPFDNEVYSYGHRNVAGSGLRRPGPAVGQRVRRADLGRAEPDHRGRQLRLAAGRGIGRRRRADQPEGVWSTSEASPSGLAFWRGALWMAALRGQRLWQIPLDGEKTGEPGGPFHRTYGRIRSVVVSAGGESLLVTNSNTDGRGDPKAGDDRLLRTLRPPSPSTSPAVAAAPRCCRQGRRRRRTNPRAGRRRRSPGRRDRPAPRVAASASATTICRLSSDPGAILVDPLPIAIEQAEPGGVSWTKRM